LLIFSITKPESGRSGTAPAPHPRKKSTFKTNNSLPTASPLARFLLRAKNQNFHQKNQSLVA
jgi:hypothetical protein